MTTFATGLGAIGLPGQDARDLASHVLSLEAAILLSRPARSVVLIEQAAKFLLQIVRAKLPKP
jgi:hypothetical protein